MSQYSEHNQLFIICLWRPSLIYIIFQVNDDPATHGRHFEFQHGRREHMTCKISRNINDPSYHMTRTWKIVSEYVNFQNNNQNSTVRWKLYGRHLGSKSSTKVHIISRAIIKNVWNHKIQPQTWNIFLCQMTKHIHAWHFSCQWYIEVFQTWIASPEEHEKGSYMPLLY